MPDGPRPVAITSTTCADCLSNTVTSLERPLRTKPMTPTADRSGEKTENVGLNRNPASTDSAYLSARKTTEPSPRRTVNLNSILVGASGTSRADAPSSPRRDALPVRSANPEYSPAGRGPAGGGGG